MPRSTCCTSGLFYFSRSRARDRTLLFVGFILFSHRFVALLRKLRLDCSPLKSAVHHCLNHPVLYSSFRYFTRFNLSTANAIERSTSLFDDFSMRIILSNDNIIWTMPYRKRANSHFSFLHHTERERSASYCEV